MKLVYAALFVAAAGLVAPAAAQTATDAVTQAAKQAATQAAVDSINKTAGTADEGKAGQGKKPKKDKDGPNWGKSNDHRQDDEHGHKSKNKHK